MSARQLPPGGPPGGQGAQQRGHRPAPRPPTRPAASSQRPRRARPSTSRPRPRPRPLGGEQRVPRRADRGAADGVELELGPDVAAASTASATTSSPTIGAHPTTCGADGAATTWPSARMPSSRRRTSARSAPGTNAPGTAARSSASRGAQRAATVGPHLASRARRRPPRPPPSPRRRRDGRPAAVELLAPTVARPSTRARDHPATTLGLAEQHGLGPGWRASSSPSTSAAYGVGVTTSTDLHGPRRRWRRRTRRGSCRCPGRRTRP